MNTYMSSLSPVPRIDKAKKVILLRRGPYPFGKSNKQN